MHSSGNQRNGRWVIVSEGGGGQSRAAVAAVKTLARNGYKPLVTVSSNLSLARASRYCARSVVVPSADRDPSGYAKAVQQEAEKLSAITVFPASDVALLALGYPVRHLVDKVLCGKAAARAGFEVPPTRVFESASEVLDRAHTLDYPIVVKPDLKRAFASRVELPAELRTAIVPMLGRPGRVMVQPYLGDALHAVVGLMWKGSLLLAMHMRYHRLWPAVCGTVASAVTIEPDGQVEQRLERLLAGYEGVFHAEFAGPYILDVNPRVHATLALAIAAGGDPVTGYCDLLSGREVAPARARAGLFFRWLEGDFRSVLHEFRGGRISLRHAFAACRPRRHTVHGYESLADLGPAWERIRFSINKTKTSVEEDELSRVPQVLASVANEDHASGAAFRADDVQGQAREGVWARSDVSEVQALDNYRAG